MAQFYWYKTPPHGACTSCATSECENGFVDTITDVNIKNDMGHVTGIVDVIYCADCLRQMGGLVGMAPAEAVLETINENVETAEANEKLKDEIQAWQQRYQNLVDLMSNTPLKEDASDTKSDISSN